VQDTVRARTVETKTRVFVSYSRKDMAFADRLEAALKARGFEVLIDREEIYAFEDWWTRIETLIGGTDTVVFVLSPDAVKSDVALKEVAYAASLNKRFAPIVCRRVEDAAVPEALRRLNFIFFDDPSMFEASADKLAEALQTDIGWIRRHTEFGDTAHRWVEVRRPSGMLLRPPVLDQAEAWLAFRPGGAPAPTAETMDFIVQSRKATLGTQRLRRIALGSIVALMMAVILGLVGWINQAYIVGEWRWWTVTLPYAKAQVWPHVLTAVQVQALKQGQSFKECANECPEMVLLPAGSFMMGAPASESQAPGYVNEIPQHVVIFAKPFAVSKYELTFADWDACVKGGGCSGHRPSDQGWGRGLQPVINVSWDDAQEYAAWLSQVTGKTYRLLSEAEHEYATRAGTTTIYPWGDDLKLNGQAMANCYNCGSKWDDQQAAPVGSFPPNKFGLYDMVGNVWEWIEDCVHRDYNGAPTDGSAWISGDCSNRVTRGGSWGFNPGGLRSEDRSGWGGTDQRNGGLGFRVGRTLSAP
jgi:formylglycine-generating enzyme required for sulfatase activity